MPSTACAESDGKREPETGAGVPGWEWSYMMKYCGDSYASRLRSSPQPVCS